eukprot:TRINITY_DN10801_c1_g1_i1.p1 TRINITY_DN10801_c1_g1~~TRINITY_DN10801_c1_g1_i1.p1  ORF type:complete len:446 (+),score=113.25 TRINITY_DN10801_c1_g1_i1:3-1340(+)
MSSLYLSEPRPATPHITGAQNLLEYHGLMASYKQFTSGNHVRITLAYILRRNVVNATSSSSSSTLEPSSTSSSSSSSSSSSIDSSSFSSSLSSSTPALVNQPSFAPSQLPSDRMIHKMTTHIRTLLHDLTFLPGGGEVGFLCSHMYSKEAAFNRPQGPLNTKLASLLKGTDRYIAQAGIDNGLCVYLKPYLIEGNADQEWELEHFPKNFKIPRKMDGSDMRHYAPVVDDDGFDIDADDMDKVIWVDKKPRFNSGANPKTFSADMHDDNPDADKLPAVQHLGSSYFSGTGYFGNEASETDFYMFAAIHITIPEVQNGERQKGEIPVFEPDYSQFKIPELKEECKKRGLKVSGTKDDLLARINEHRLKVATAAAQAALAAAEATEAAAAAALVTVGANIGAPAPAPVAIAAPPAAKVDAATVRVPVDACGNQDDDERKASAKKPKTT